MKDKDVLLAFEAQEMMPKEPEPWQDLPEERPPIFPTVLLPERWGKLITDYAKAVVVPVDYVACAMLGTVSSAIVGRIDVVPRDGQWESVQLYQFFCGEPSTRKTAALTAFSERLVSYLEEKNEEIRKQNRENSHRRELLLNAAKGKGKSIEDRVKARMQADEIEDVAEYEKIMGNATLEAIEDRMRKQGGSGIVLTDEGSIVDIATGYTYARQGGRANIDTLLSAWNGGMVNVDRIGRESFSITRADLSITLGVQPIHIRSMTESESAAGRGLPQRFLYYLPDMLVGQNVMNLPPYPQMQLNAWHDYVSVLADTHRDKRCEMQLTSGAKRLFIEFWQDMTDRSIGDMGENARLKEWGGKAHGQAARIAAILALLEDPHTIIVEESHMRNAVALMNEYYIPHAKRAFGGGSTLSAPAKALCEVLRTPIIKKGEEPKLMTSFKKYDLHRRVAGQNRYKRETGKQFFDQVFEELKNCGYVRELPAEKTPGRGRPPESTWEVHPALCGVNKPIQPVQEGCL